ncbi:class I SAM-dependent methyltransferase [Pullulanibacillus sp. KACC 23026]|uniref:class I SAM-dependent methyltransferase n=1 Tax=Pullulanibacillus sp. KACC 23026 TaxID=3028315 RepID=UPI0023B0326B|nr:class I SAM-dependent methyltransferase [Pullulanibacillus sp. KACC 23026]WEG14547.1 class I SAM-dependent methyltransferase [Pullulanibacillus sp. KACC 23026]
MENENKGNVQHQFGKSAASYVNSPIHKEGRDLKKLVEIADTVGTEELLDIATGGGHTANAFASLVKQVTALDLTKEMLEAAEQFITGNGHQNVKFVSGDAESLPFPNQSFDLVTCRIAAHHFPHVQAFISEVARVLRTNGQFLLDDNVVPESDVLDQFYNQLEKMRDYSHFRAWKKSEWIRMLETSGLVIQEWHRFEKTFQFAPWCDRMNLSPTDKDALTQFLLNSSHEMKQKFEVVIENDIIQSFKGEAFVLKATKPSN